MKLFYCLFFLLGTALGQELKTGADRLLSDSLHLLKGKNIGLVTNHTGVLSNGSHLADTLNSFADFKLKALFGPEHGIRGDAPAGEEISTVTDPETGIPVYSLYGKDRKPTTRMLEGIDLLIFDIQDVGARFYTYISTLFYILQSATENDIPVIVLDRPNPIGGVYVDGPVRKDSLTSFVGIAPIPIAHGMTVGELAMMFSGEGWLKSAQKPVLSVITMEGWRRKSYYDDYAGEWIRPSPNIPDLETALVYPGTCLIEGMNVSEGRGTQEPFLRIGAPFINPKDITARLNEFQLAAVQVTETEFTPVSIPGMAGSPKYENELCRGVFIRIRNRDRFEPVKFGIMLAAVLYELYPGRIEFRKSFDLLTGDGIIRQGILKGKSPRQIISSYEKELKDFLAVRKKYLLYN